jgi:hypothetical protein
MEKTAALAAVLFCLRPELAGLIQVKYFAVPFVTPLACGYSWKNHNM